MRLSYYSDYALRVLMSAALCEPQITTIDSVARSFNISRNHLVKIVHMLGRKGFLATRRGTGGGFKLALPAANIRLGDVIRLTEGSDKVINCMEKQTGSCRLFPVCRLKGILDEAADAFFLALDQYTLEDLVKQPSGMKKLLNI
jgi:Rrf2 family nitric oxide-sensitive transcriptional repressor